LGTKYRSQLNRLLTCTQRYTKHGHTHTQSVRPRERWQAKKWRAKRSNRRTTEQNREGGARHSRNFTSSKGCFVHLTAKPYEPSVQNRHVSVIDVNDVDDEEGKNVKVMVMMMMISMTVLSDANCVVVSDAATHGDPYHWGGVRNTEHETETIHIHTYII